MERDSLQRYADSLEKTIRSNHHYLKEAIKDFQGMCQMVTPERNVPPEIILDIREAYKEIRTRLTEIKAIEQVLQGKYRQYYRRDPLRSKDILEFGFVCKNCYSKFEYTIMQKEAQKKAKEKDSRGDPMGMFRQWFHSKENQVTFVRNLRILHDLDYEKPPDSATGERRQVTQDRPRSLTLFVFSGDKEVIDDLQSRMRVREHDVFERHAPDEIHGLLTHLREIDPAEVEKKFKDLMGSGEFSKLKCLLFSLHSSKHLEDYPASLIRKTLQEMSEGEVRAISISHAPSPLSSLKTGA